MHSPKSINLPGILIYSVNSIKGVNIILPTEYLISEDKKCLILIKKSSYKIKGFSSKKLC